MRKINPSDFTLATYRTSREINRQIALTLIRTHQPVSRAELSRLMETNRANVTLLVSALLEEGIVREGDRADHKVRGRKPTFLYLNSQDRVAVAVDIRASGSLLMVTDSLGKQISEIVSFPTERKPDDFLRSLARQIRKALNNHGNSSNCLGIGVSVPGMLDRRSGILINAPTLH